MQTKEALKIIGGSLSKPSKMPGWSIGLPAKECKTGGKLQAVKGSVCLRLLRAQGLLRLQGCAGCTVPETGSTEGPSLGHRDGTFDQQQEARRVQMARLGRCTRFKSLK